MHYLSIPSTMAAGFASVLLILKKLNKHMLCCVLIATSILLVYPILISFMPGWYKND